MFEERDGEKEILLGNKQLIGIFFALAILFGVFFTAGYMVGRSNSTKSTTEAAAAAPAEAKPDTAAEARADTTARNAETPGETHAVNPEPSASRDERPAETKPAQTESAKSETVLGARKKPKPVKAEVTRSEMEREPAASPAAPVTAAASLPAGRNTYLQVAALGRTDAESVARVLRKKGFSIHIAPKTGTPYYRVLVGPIRDAGELNTTRDALKSKEGFREVFVQHL
jgi:cell division septation protein DedD